MSERESFLEIFELILLKNFENKMNRELGHLAVDDFTKCCSIFINKRTFEKCQMMERFWLK